MCCSIVDHSIYLNERDRLKIRAFYLRLSISNAEKPLPETLTLRYLPRINGDFLEINDAKIRCDSGAFVSLHRVRSEEKAVFASTELVRASEGVWFEVYLREEKVMKGIFRKDEDEMWQMECKCALESDPVGFAISEAEVCVAGEGCVVMNEKVEMVVRRRKRRVLIGLEDIPEEKEIESDGCDCGELDSESDGCDCEDFHDVVETEGVRWAVDVGIWVMCLGVGLLVSKASSKSLRRRWVK